MAHIFVYNPTRLGLIVPSPQCEISHILTIRKSVGGYGKTSFNFHIQAQQEEEAKKKACSRAHSIDPASFCFHFILYFHLDFLWN